MRFVISYFDPWGIGVFDFLAVFFIMLRRKFSGNLAVKGGKFGFELLQFVLFAPWLRDDGFEVGNIGFEFGGMFLILGDDAGYLLQSVDEIHAGGIGVAHGDEAVVELVFVVAFDHKTVLYCLDAVSQGFIGDYAYWEAIDFADALILTDRLVPKAFVVESADVKRRQTSLKIVQYADIAWFISILSCVVRKVSGTLSGAGGTCP